MKRLLLTKLTLSLLAFSANAQDKGDLEKQLRLTPGDERGNELKALKTELLVTKSEVKALQELERLAKKHSGTRLEPEIKLRLAEMYMRRARTHRFFEVHRDSKTVSQSLRMFPDVVKGISERNQIKKAIDLYEVLQSKFPYFRSIDLVIFNAAYAYQQLGNDKSAEAKYKLLIVKHHGSPLMADALLAVAEIHYQRRQFEQALAFLKDLRNYPQSRAYPYGIYKTAWCHYNLQDAKSGLKWLEEVIKYGRQIAGNQGDRKLDLRHEALTDMALFFLDSESSSKAVAYFDSQAGDLGSNAYLLRLTGLYKSHSRYADIDTVLNGIVEKNKAANGLAEVYEELIWNSDRVKNRKKSVAWLEKMDEYCQTTKSKAGECSDSAIDNSRKLATRWHAQWNALNKEIKVEDDAIRSAESAYAIYIKRAKASVEGYSDVRFAYGELLFTRKKFRTSSEMYAGVDLKALKEKEKHGAAYGAVVAMERAVETETSGKWSDKDEATFRALTDKYLAHYPKSDYAPEIKFSRSFIAYDKQRYDEAAPGLYKLGWQAEKPHSKQQKSQDLYLDILNMKKDFKSMRLASATLLKAKLSPERNAQITKIYRESYFSEIQQMEEKAPYATVVQSYLTFAKENSTHELGIKAWWNASQLQFKHEDMESGAQTCEKMKELFAQSPAAKECLLKSVQTYEAMGRVESASRAALAMADLDKPQATQWRETAADFLSLSSRPQTRKEAAQAYIQMVSTGKHPKTNILKVVAIAEELKDRALIATGQKLANDHGVVEVLGDSQLEAAQNLLKKGDFAAAFAASRKIINRDGNSKVVVAKARLIQAQILDDEYRKQSTKAKVERLGAVLALKTDKLGKAQRAYQEVVQFGVPEVSATALQKLSDCYFDFGTSVRKAAQIPGLGAEDAKALNAEIENLAVPMEEKGAETLSQAIALAKKAKLRGGRVAELEREFNKRNMRETELQPRAEEPPVAVPSQRGFFLGRILGGGR